MEDYIKINGKSLVTKRKMCTQKHTHKWISINRWFRPKCV